MEAAVKVATYSLVDCPDDFPIELSFWLRDNVTLGTVVEVGAAGGRSGGGTCTKSESGGGASAESWLFRLLRLMRDRAELIKLMLLGFAGCFSG